MILLKLINVTTHMPTLRIWPLSLFVLSPKNSTNFIILLTLIFRGHHIKVNDPDWQSQGDTVIAFPLLPFGLKNHARNTLKLLPTTTMLLEQPSPIKHLNILKHLQII